MTASLVGTNKFPKSFGDSKNDLGYGRLSAKFHKERSQGGTTFPYIEEPQDLQHIDVDEELLDLVMKKLDIPRDYDPMPTLDSEGQYFVSGNSKLSEMSNSISPIPNLYKNRMRASIGTSGAYPQGYNPNIRPTGSKYGYSTMYNDTEESDDPAYTLEDIEEKQLEEFRCYVREILLMELK